MYFYLSMYSHPTKIRRQAGGGGDPQKTSVSRCHEKRCIMSQALALKNILHKDCVGDWTHLGVLNGTTMRVNTCVGPLSQSWAASVGTWAEVGPNTNRKKQRNFCTVIPEIKCLHTLLQLTNTPRHPYSVSVSWSSWGPLRKSLSPIAFIHPSASLPPPKKNDCYGFKK